jgi:hypothetical protein
MEGQGPMTRVMTSIFAAVALLLMAAGTALALSEELRSPRINFAKGYDARRVDAVQAVLTNKQYHYLDGLISYWPPEWSTMLVYAGDTKSLKSFLEELSQVKGMHVRVQFSKDLSKETGSALSAGSWFVKYRQTEADTITVRVNLAAKDIDLSEIELWLSREKDQSRPD